MKIERELLAQALIVLAICIGGWVLVVQPRVVEVHGLEALIAHHDAILAGSENEGLLDQDMVARIADEAKAIRAKVAAIEEANALSHDSSQLYAAMMELARSNGVFVHTLNPGSPSDQGSSAKNAGGARVRTFSMTVQADFDRLGSFLDALNSMPGFLRPTTLTLTPHTNEEGKETIVAHLAYDILSFVIPEPLLAMRGGDRAGH